MDRISAAEVRIGAAHEAVRADEHRRLAADATARRVELGEDLALVFQDRATLRAALEESLRVERRREAADVDEGLAALNAMLPGSDELLATIYVVVADAALLGDRATALSGLAGSMELLVGGRPSPAIAVPGEDLASGACSIRFALDAEQRAAWRAGADVAVAVDHLELRLRTPLSAAQRDAVGADLSP